MAKKTLEEIERLHMARAARKAGMTPDDDDEQPDTDDVDDELHEQDQQPDEAQHDEAPNPLEAEIERLRQQLDAANGRAAPAQRQAEEYRSLFDEERRAREQERHARDQEIAELREQLEARQAEISLDELLTEEERDLMDPAQLQVFKKLAEAAARRAAPKVDVRGETARFLQEREAQRLKAYREDVLTDPRKGVSALATLAGDPAFQEWTAQEDNEDFDPLVRSMLSATTEREIDRYAKAVAKRITKFNEHRAGGKSAARADARTSRVAAAMQRRPRRLTDDEIGDKLNEAKQLARSRNPKDRQRAKEILDAI